MRGYEILSSTWNQQLYLKRSKNTLPRSRPSFPGSRIYVIALRSVRKTTPLPRDRDQAHQSTPPSCARLIDPGNPGPVGGPSPPDPDLGGNPPGRAIRFADLVSGRNAVATANAVDGMPTGNEIYGPALTLPSGALQSFFSTLSGKSHANAIGALLGLGAQARNVPFSRLRTNLGAGMHPGSPTAAVGASDTAPPSSVLPADGSQPAWAELVENWQRLGATGDTSEVRMHTGGIFAGADGAIGCGWRLGSALGYTDSNLRTDGVDGETDISSYSAVVYGGKAFDAGAGKLNLLLGTVYTWHDIYGASTAQVFTELGWALKAGDALTLEPYGGLAWQSAQPCVPGKRRQRRAFGRQPEQPNHRQHAGPAGPPGSYVGRVPRQSQRRRRLAPCLRRRAPH